jgi:hypothetical protein
MDRLLTRKNHAASSIIRVFLTLAVCTYVFGHDSQVHAGENEGLAPILKRADEKECARALTSIETERARRIAGIRGILQGTGTERPSDEAAKYALLALGKLKAVEAVDLLITRIDFIPSSGDVKNEDRPFSFTKRYPAVVSLVAMGRWVIDDLLRAVAEDKLSEQGRRNVGWIIFTILGKDKGKKKVVAYASQLDKDVEKKRVLSKTILIYFDYDSSAASSSTPAASRRTREEPKSKGGGTDKK